MGQDQLAMTSAAGPVEPILGSKGEDVNLTEFASAFGSSYVSSVQEAMSSFSEKNKLDNVAIFVDYDNVYWTLMKNYNHIPDHEDPNRNLFVRLWEIYNPGHIRTFRAYADFQQIRDNLTSLQKKRVQIRHVYSNGKNSDHRKNSSDIELCIDVIESTYKDPGITCYVIVTADSDMIPILSRLRYKGKRVELYYVKKAAPQHVDISTFADHSMDLSELLKLTEPSFNMDALMVEALAAIAQWHRENASKDNWLGQVFLKNFLVKSLGMPERIISDVIEHLMVNEYIEQTSTLTGQGRKAQTTLTAKGETMVAKRMEAISEAAAGSENRR